MVSYHSSLPTFRNELSTISSMLNNTILVCDSFNNERRNFIVVDEVSIRNNFGASVQTAYDNKWIIDFGASTKQLKYVWHFSTDDINVFDNICLRQDILKIKDNVKVIVNGTEIPQANWDFFDYRRYYMSSFGDYCQHILFNSVPAGGQTLDIEYYEDIQNDQNYRLSMKRADGLSVVNKKIPLTTSDQFSDQWYLDSMTISDKFTGAAHYINFDGSGSTLDVDKNFSTHLYVVQFPYEYKFDIEQNMVLEMWKTTDRKSGGDFGRYNGWNSNYSNMLLYREFGNNTIDFYGDNIKTGIYQFRMRNTVTNEVSEWFDNKLSLNPIKIFTTDITVSNKTYQACMYSPKLI